MYTIHVHVCRHVLLYSFAALLRESVWLWSLSGKLENTTTTRIGDN